MKQQEVNFLDSMEQLEKPLLDLARKMAAEVIQVEVQSGADTDFILTERLRKMLYEIVEQNNIIIEVNPAQLNLIKTDEMLEDLNLKDKTDVKIIGNPGLKPGEAQVGSEEYFIDGTFENHINKTGDDLEKGQL